MKIPTSCETFNPGIIQINVPGIEPHAVNTLIRKLRRYSVESLGSLASLLGGSAGPIVASGVVEAVQGASTVWLARTTRGRIRQLMFELLYGSRTSQNEILWLHNAFEWPIRSIRPEEKVIDIWSE